MDENGKTKSIDTLQDVLSENFENFQVLVQNVFCESAQKYITEEIQSVIKKIKIQIELWEPTEYEEKIVLGDGPQKDDIFRQRELEKLLAFSNDDIQVRMSSSSYSCKLAVIYHHDFDDNLAIVVRPLVFTIFNMLEKALTNLAAFLGKKYPDKSAWINFKNKIDSMDFMECYIIQLMKLYNFHKLDELEKICYENYEKREITGTLCLIGDGEYTEGEICRFRKFISEEEAWNVSCMRKMLEASSGEKSCLLADKENLNLIGIAISDMAMHIMAKSWKICFIEKGKWSMYEQNVQLLYYENGKYVINQKKVENNIENDVDNIMLIPWDKRKTFYRIFKALNELEHGALMIISSDAQESAMRLCSKYNRGTEVYIELEKDENIELLKKIASVDGAVMVGIDAICYGFGVILDGEARIKGERARGARYNSACNYIAGKNECAIIISEDKERGIEIKDGLKLQVI